MEIEETQKRTLLDQYGYSQRDIDFFIENFDVSPKELLDILVSSAKLSKGITVKDLAYHATKQELYQGDIKI